VATMDCTDTAATLYSALDGLEFEHSAMVRLTLTLTLALRPSVLASLLLPPHPPPPRALFSLF
jgi:hypothetical protein